MIQLRINSISKRLDDTYTALSQERARRIAVEREFRELTEEYNGLVQETLQERAETFSPQPRGQKVASITRMRLITPAPVARGDHDHA